MKTYPTFATPDWVAPLRAQFPILSRKVYGKNLVYFDNAATNQKPRSVIQAITNYYENSNANIHRGLHCLANEATQAFELSREKTKQFINAKHESEIVFTRGTTESINLVAYAYAMNTLQAGDEILLSELEHHSNIVPWQMAAEKTGAKIQVIPITEEGDWNWEVIEKKLTSKTKIVSLNQISNSLGTVNDVEKLIGKAHAVGAKVLIDGAQAVAHIPVDVQKLSCDFYAFSSHKMFGPTGVGVLYIKQKIADAMLPFLGGGEMIKNVTFEKTTYNTSPHKFEAGTPNIADVVAFAAAIDFMQSLDQPAVMAYEDALLHYATDKLRAVEKVTIIGNPKKRISVLPFVSPLHYFDMGQLLDARGVAVRTGHHCTQPLMTSYCVEGTVRASFCLYNTKEEVDYWIEQVQDIIKKFA